MKVKIQQFLFGKNHSWSLVGKNIGRSLLKKGHDVHFLSTDGFNEKYVESDIKPHIISKPDSNYDMQISYTAMINFRDYLSNGDKNRFGIWNYEYRGGKLLPGFAKNYKYVDKLFPSSNFSKEVFRDMGVPENKMVVIPHGIDLDVFKTNEKFNLNTNKKTKILLNIAQPHKRKALHLALESFGKAFSKEDDVCLVAKVSTSNKTQHSFNVDFFNLLKTFKQKFPNHAEIKVVTEFIPNIAELYNSCHINFSATHAECWHLPSLEALAAGLINVVPRYGGQLDFCNDNNSLFIDGKIKRAPRDHQYWNYSPYGQHFVVNTDNAAEKLIKSVNEYDKLIDDFGDNMFSTAKEFTWDNAVDKILELAE